MNSCLYDCNVMHYRLEPKKNRFMYNVFMFYLDLDELDQLEQHLWLVSRNRFNVFSFRDDDHLRLSGKNIKENVLEYLRTRGVELNGGRIMLLTHLRMFGYIFNPVSFYFCFDASGNPVCTVAEVSNTFREMKPFFIGPQDFQDNQFHLCTTKYFYVSPFIDLDVDFEFKLKVPGESLGLLIDDIKQGNKFFLSSVTGTRRPLSDARLAWYVLKFPFITLKVIFLIHWQAMILHVFKGIGYHKKAAHPDLQREVYNAQNPT